MHLTPAERRRQSLINLRRNLRRDWEIFAAEPLAILGIVLIVFFGVMAISFPLLRATVLREEIYNPLTGYDFRILQHPAPPSWLPQPDIPMHTPSFTHLLGTDGLGHDVFSMLLHATTPTFLVGISAALVTAFISTIFGMVSAYYGGRVDDVLSHLMDGVSLVPAPLLMIMVGMRFRALDPVTLGVIYGVVSGAGSAAIVMRAQALSIVNRPFVEAARVAGGGGGHIIFRHILPHMLPLAGLYMMLSVTGAVVADGFLSFFGLSRSYLNWGSIIYSSFTYSSALGTGVEWHVLIPPSLALSIFAAAFYLVGRGLHLVADPRLRDR
jgi:peptide/nickel transport system permease protein